MHRLEPGDLILVKSPGAVYALGRLLSGNPFDHVAVVLDGGQTLNIDKPEARLLPAPRLLRARLRPLILRPSFADEAERAAFIAFLTELRGSGYDTRRTLALIPRVLARRFLGLRIRHRRLPPERAQWICTDAILVALERSAARFAEIRSLSLDWVEIDCATTNDFLRIERERPDLLRRVA